MKRIMRADVLRTSANDGKVQRIRRFISDYRRLAAVVGREQWRLVFYNGRTNKDHTPKVTMLPANVFGPLAPANWMNAFCGAAPVQMARYQVVGQLDSWLSNRANEFKLAVQNSSLAPDVKRRLHTLNSRGLIYLPGSGDFTLLEVKDRKGRQIAPRIDISAPIRRLARNIMRSVVARHRKPNLSNISPCLDSRSGVVAPSRTRHADFWVTLELPKEKEDDKRTKSGKVRRDTISIPLHTNKSFTKRGGKLCPVVQLCTEPDGGISVRLISDMTETFAKERIAYRPERECLTLDFGLSVMFASDEGDLLGRRWLNQLRRYDAKIQSVARHMQKIGKKPRDSRRYRETVADVRGFVRTEINRVLNRLMELKKPAELLLERIDFRHSEIGPRLNRIVRNCGRSVIQAKLADLNQRRGIISHEMNPAYSSQECELCGFVSRGNRPTRDKFRCLWCGHTAHADVNGSRTLRARRPGSVGAITARGQKGALLELASRFMERMKSQARLHPQCNLGRRSDVLRRSAFVRRLKADQIASLGLTPYLVSCG